MCLYRMNLLKRRGEEVLPSPSTSPLSWKYFSATEWKNEDKN